MENISEYSGNVIEILPTHQTNSDKEFFNASSLANTFSDLKNASTQTNTTNAVMIQTDTSTRKQNKTDKKNIPEDFKNINSILLNQLKQKITPTQELVLNYEKNDITIKPYQIINFNTNLNNHFKYKGLCTWLSVKANTAPVLVVIGVAIYDNNTIITDEKNNFNNLESIIKIYNPIVQEQNYILFVEKKFTSIKTTINHLSTNPFNKEIFCAGTVQGDIYIWLYSNSISTNNVLKEKVCVTTDHGSVVSLGWLSEINLLSCHESGIIILWKLTENSLINSKEFKVVNPKKPTITSQLTTLLVISYKSFIVGTSEGNLFYFSYMQENFRIEGNFTNPTIVELKQHRFGVKTLMKNFMSTGEIVLSCDLSGEIYFHDITFTEDGPQLVYRLTLPFKNTFVIWINSDFLLFPDQDGSLDILNINDGTFISKVGYEKGRPNFMKISDNGFWLAAGINNGWVQIHKIEN